MDVNHARRFAAPCQYLDQERRQGRFDRLFASAGAVTIIGATKISELTAGRRVLRHSAGGGGKAFGCENSVARAHFANKDDWCTPAGRSMPFEEGHEGSRQIAGAVSFYDAEHAFIKRGSACRCTIRKAGRTRPGTAPRRFFRKHLG